MPDPSRVNSRRAQTLVAVREMILRGEFASRKTIEEVELSRALGASRPIVHATLEKLHQEGLLEELSARCVRASRFQRAGHRGCH